MPRFIERLRRPPDLLTLHTQHPDRYPCLLESAAHDTPQARYNILFALPERHIVLNQPNALPDKFLTLLDENWRQASKNITPDTTALPFSGGWLLYLGYELTAEIEPLTKLPTTANSLPTAIATRIPAALIYDHQTKDTWLVAETESQHAAIMADIQASEHSSHEDVDVSEIVEHLQEEAESVFQENFERVQRHIRAGDVYQVNLSRLWQATLLPQIDSVTLYRCLRQANPAPFAALYRWQNQAIISSSPERLIRVQQGQIDSRPIAGTHPRAASPQADQAIAQALLEHPKEQAEHIMLLDLIRNDLSRVSRPGSVEVDEYMVLETYAHVHHIVSNVTGRLRDGVTPGEAISAVFPGGTITGCPKIRCMQIIHDCEQALRGPYTGSLGYLNHDGSMDLNILIRTLHLNDRALSFRAGGGLVVDSDPDRELQETRAKANGMLRALGVMA